LAIPGLDLRVHFIDPEAVRMLGDEIFGRRCYSAELDSRVPTIVDVGANIGLATLYFKRRWPSAEIIAIEPSEPAFAILRRNIAENGISNVATFNVAVGAREGIAHLYRDPNGGNPTMSLDPSRGGTVAQIIEVKTLSQLLPPKTDLLKIDVEGAEREVLFELGSAGMLPSIRRLIVEVHHRPEEPDRLIRILEMLAEAGFSIMIRADSADRWRAADQDVLVYAAQDAGSQWE
jgi:FkbM family methyltransferase